MRYCNDPSEIIDALGGPAAVGRLTGYSGKAVWNWRQRGFPRRTLLVLRPAIEKQGIRAPDTLWGMLIPVSRELAE